MKGFSHPLEKIIGFTTLFENMRMNLSVEKIILEPRYRELFSNDDLLLAYRCLKEFKYERLDDIEVPYPMEI